jgi:CspA family cold shock protein
MAERVSGNVKFFNPNKGWGFIEREDGDVFVHANDLPDGLTALSDGQGVTFELRPGKKGLRAVNVELAT